jgi:hypothetical protein
MFRTALVFTACLVLACSCKKKDNPPIDPVVVAEYPNYIAMKPGNYWIYQRYTLDSANGNATAENSYDSCYVEKDTVVGGKTYHKYLSVNIGWGVYDEQYLMDSLSYVVTTAGRIIFSSDDFNSIFRTIKYNNPPAGVMDTIDVTERMDYKDKQVVVPAGQFKTSTFRRMYHLPAPTYQYGPYRTYDYSYAENVGLIKATVAWYINTEAVYERRLVRYHVQ